MINYQDRVYDDTFLHEARGKTTVNNNYVNYFTTISHMILAIILLQCTSKQTR